VRGAQFSEFSILTTQAALMSRYHVPYSEIKDMPLRTVMFLLEYADAADQYQQQQIDRAKNKGKGRRL